MRNYVLILCLAAMSAKAEIIASCPNFYCSASFSGRSAVGNELFLAVTVGVMSSGNPDGFPLPGTATMTDSVITSGISRPGWITLDFSGFTELGTGGSFASALINFGPYPRGDYANTFKPITLGEVIPILVNVTFRAGNQPGGAGTDQFLRVRFFEDNAGSPGAEVPVAFYVAPPNPDPDPEPEPNVDPVPEPSMLLPASTILAGVILSRQFSRRGQKRFGT